MLPYQGVKFIPKLSHKYTIAEPFSNLEERSKQLAAKKNEIKKLQEIEPNKPMIVLNDKKPMISGNQTLQHPRLNNSINKNVNKENSMSAIEHSNENANNKTQNCGNDSILSNKVGNLSTLSNSSRKRVVDLKPMNLHTEARAQKRQQYDKYLKDKERMAELIKKNLEMQKMIESKNEIQKMRSQLLFKSKPFKQLKAMEIKPSEKPLTEPKSPHLGLILAAGGTSSSKLNASNNKSTTRSLSQDNLRIN